MDHLPIDLHAHVMRMYFTHHVLDELAQFDFKARRTNTVVGTFVDILNDRIRTQLRLSLPNAAVLKRLRYARDRWSTHLFSHKREQVHGVQ